MEHETCKDCEWNNYPTCKGTIMSDGLEMNIEKLKPGFMCGREPVNFSVKLEIYEELIKSELELKLEELEKRIEDLEKK